MLFYMHIVYHLLLTATVIVHPFMAASTIYQTLALNDVRAQITCSFYHEELTLSFGL